MKLPTWMLSIAQPQLRLSVMLKSLGMSLYGIYEPIILYEIFDQNLSIVIFYYALVGIWQCCLFVFSSRLVTRIGMKGNFVSGTVFLVFGLFFLMRLSGMELSWTVNQTAIVVNLLPVVVFIGLYKSLYWFGYHLNISHFIPQDKDAETVGWLRFITSTASVAGPLIGGLILVNISTQFLLLIALIIIALSVIPLLFLKNIKPTAIFSIREIFQEVFSLRHWRHYLPYFVEGTTIYIRNVIWPLFIFINIVSVIGLGAIAAGVSFLSGIMNLFLGKKLDKNLQLGRKVLQIGIALDSLGWLLKGLATTVLPIFIFDNTQKMGVSIYHVPFSQRLYKRFQTTLTLADEQILAREIAIHTVGPITLLFIGIVVAQFDFIYIAFIFAAIATWGRLTI